MPKTFSVKATYGVAIKRPMFDIGSDMATTVIAFHPDDCVAVLEALNIKNMPKMWNVSDLTVLLRSGHAGKVCKPLEDAGISFNYASYAGADSMSPTQAGQVRYGHDGIEMHLALVPDPQLAALYSRYLPGEQQMDNTTYMRICFVCCGQDSWADRIENGRMHQMRRLLT